MSSATDPVDTDPSGVIDPVSPETIKRMGVLYLAFSCLVFYLLIATWPILEMVEAGKPAKAFQSFNVFGFWCRWAPDRQMLFTVMAAGALGSLVHALTSFGDFVGNRKLSANWIWWLILRVPIGVALAVLFYFLIRGGLIVPTMQSAPNTNAYEAVLQFNPYSLAAFAALAGMFSKQATDKFGEIFTALFALKKPVDREGALSAVQPTINGPLKLTKGKAEALTVGGGGFQEGAKATINGNVRDLQWISPMQVKVSIAAADVEKPGKLDLVITNKDGGTVKAAIEVLEPAVSNAAAVKPEIAGPVELRIGAPSPVSFTGKGFLEKCTATVNGADRKVDRKSETQIDIALDPADVAAPGKLQVVIKNAGSGGLSSDPFTVEVK